MTDDTTTQDEQRQREADDQHQDEHGDTQDDVQLQAAGREALKRERDARKAAEKERTVLAKRIADLEKAQKDRDDEAAKAQGEWEKVAKTREGELEEARKLLADRDLRDRKTAIARNAGIPDEFVDRLKGETDEELEVDAKAVAKLLKTRDAPDNDAGERTPRGMKKPDKNEFANPARWGLRS